MTTYKVEVQFTAQLDLLKAQIGQVISAQKQVIDSSAGAGMALVAMGNQGAAAVQQIQQAVGGTSASMQRLSGSANLATKDIQQAASQATRSIHDTAAGTSQAAGEMSGALTSLASKLGLIALGWKAVKSALGIGEMGIEYNKVMEGAQLGIGSLIAAQAKLVDGKGQELKGQEALNAALILSTDQMQKLKIAGLETVATTQQLVGAFQQAVGAGLSVGLNLDQIRILTIQITQAAAALQMPMNQLAEEVRDLLQGNINPRNTRIATALNISSEDIRNWKAAGTLFEEIYKRMEPFSLAGEKMALTWSGVTSNVVEAAQTMTGAMTAPLFERLKTSLQNALKDVFDLKNARISDTFSGLVEGGQAVADAIGTLVQDALLGLMMTLRDLSTWLRENKAEVQAFADRMKGMAEWIGQNLLSAIGDLVQLLWSLRDPLLALANAWMAMKVADIVKGIVEWGAAKVALVQQTLAARMATIQEGLATAGLTLAKEQDAKAEIARALAIVASRKATIDSAVATGLMSIADAEAAREAIRLTEAKLAEAVAVEGAGRAGTLAAKAMAALGGPVGVLITLLGGLVFVLSMVKDSTDKVAKAEADRLAQATRDRQASQTLIDDANRLSLVLNNAKASTDEKRKAQEQLQVVIKQLLLIYPELTNHLKKEGELYLWSTENAKEHTKRKLEDAQASAKKAEATIKEAEAEIALAMAKANASPVDARTGTGPGDYLRLEAERRSRALQGTRETLGKALAEVQELQKRMDILNAGDVKATSKPQAPEVKDQSGIISALEIEARLATIRASAEEKTTLELQRRSALDKAEAEYLHEAAKLQKEAKEGKFDGNQAGVNELWAANIQRRKDREATINREFDDKRVQMEADLQARLTAGEEGGLQQRQEAVRKAFDKIRAEAIKLRTSEWTDAQKAAQDEEIRRAEEAARARARQDQIKADLGKVKQELAELAQIKGGPLTSGEMAEALDRFAKKSPEAAAAVQKLRMELHLGAGAWEGFADGVEKWLTNASNLFETFKAAAGQLIGGTESAVGGFFRSIVQQGQTAAQKWDALWKGMSNSVLQALSQIMAKQAVAWGVEKAISAWRDITGKKEIAQEGLKTAAKVAGAATSATASGTEAAAAGTATAANVGKGASGFFAAYSGIPWVGVALALAGIAVMMQVMKSITARAVGGLVSKPEMTLLGEAGPEVVAPEKDFKHWAGSLVNMGANLQSNVQRNDRAVMDYSYQSASFASAASEAQRAGFGSAGENQPIVVKVYQNAPVWDPSQRGLRGMGESIIDATRASVRERSVVLRAGEVFGGF